MKTIAIIDDDVYIGDMLEKILLEEHYAILRAFSGTEALLLFSRQKPDLILLDLMLPGLSGEELLPKIQNIPTIVVSAKWGIDDKVAMLLSGAADYITKPFDIKELLARIAVQLRKTSMSSDSHTIEFGGMILDTASHCVSRDKHETKLTRTEYAIFKLLMQNPTQVIPKSLILDRISLDTPDCTEQSLKMHMSNLRKKLRDIGDADSIEAVWGIGFKMRTE
ncbi:MAG: response regulator transcription factor [Clostridia bacterium]